MVQSVGGEVPEGHDAVPKSYYESHSVASRVWGLQNDFVKAVEDVRHRGHKAACRLIEEFELEDFFFDPDEKVEEAPKDEAEEAIVA